MICPPASLVVQRHYDMCRQRPRFLTQLKHGKMWKHVEALERTATRFLTCVMQNKSVIKENYPSPHTSTDSIVCERSFVKRMQGDKGKIGGWATHQHCNVLLSGHSPISKASYRSCPDLLFLRPEIWAWTMDAANRIPAMVCLHYQYYQSLSHLSLLTSLGIEIFLQPLDFDVAWVAPVMVSPDVPRVPGSKESDLVVKTSSEPQSSALGSSTLQFGRPGLVAPLCVPKANTRETLASRDLSPKRSMWMETKSPSGWRILEDLKRIAKVQGPKGSLDTTKSDSLCAGCTVSTIEGKSHRKQVIGETTSLRESGSLDWALKRQKYI